MEDTGSTSRLETGALATELVPAGSVEYAVIVPVGHDAGSEPLPLLLQLHGGGGSRQQLIEEHASRVWDRRMADGVIPPVVIAMISGLDGTYMD